MIQIRGLTLAFGKQVVFDNISLTIDAYDRVGLVGRNGTGKSTLLSLLASDSLPAGITRLSSVKIGYIPQQVTLVSSLPVDEEIIADLKLEDEVDTERLRAEGKRILMGLGFDAEKLAQPVTNLSVGWRMRLVLAKLLLAKADFYFFDEPTNHLDIVSKEWFANFLRNASFGFMLVCHERYFLDNFCTSIIELEHGKAQSYEGNYTTYLELKAEERERLESAYALQQKDIATKQANIDRFRASASRAAMAKSMQKALDRIERIVLPPGAKKVNFSFPTPPPCAKGVLAVHNISFSYQDKSIFKNVSFEIERGQKVALVAANGVGKTTLLNILMSRLTQTTGAISWTHDAIKAYFEQDQAQALNQNETIEECVDARAPRTATSSEIRAMLGCFLFSGDTVKKQIKVLSGGEKNRVAMTIVLLQSANVLLLDEPTNHLDLPSKEILLQALSTFKGTIIFVSHDQDFVNRLATHIIELTPNGAWKYEGNYDSFLVQRAAALAATAPAQSNTQKAAPTPTPKPKSKDRDTDQVIKQLEQSIKKAENDMVKVTQELELLTYGTPEFATQAQKLKDAHEKLNELVKTWEEQIAA